MKRNNKKTQSVLLIMLILAIGIIVGAYALLNDSVTLTGTAKVADNVQLEITSITLDENAFASEINENFAPTCSVSSDKKSATFSLGEIKNNENCYAQYNVVVTNKSNVPVTLTSSTVNNKLNTAIGNFGYYIDGTEEILGQDVQNSNLNEILAPGATCTFTIDVRPDAEAEITYGDELTSTITISGTQYTDSETPLQSHTHQIGFGGL